LLDRYKDGKKLSGIIYMHRVSDIRVGGISTRNFKLFRELCGENAMKNVAVVTTRWDQVSLSVGEARESQLRNDFFKAALDKGAKLLRHSDNTEQSAREIVRCFLTNVPIGIAIQEDLVDMGKDLSQTRAAATINSIQEELQKQHEEEMRKRREEFRLAEIAREAEARKRAADELRALQLEMARENAAAERRAAERRAELEAIEEARREDNELAGKILGRLAVMAVVAFL
jgi:hypothetical protein